MELVCESTSLPLPIRIFLPRSTYIFHRRLPLIFPLWLRLRRLSASVVAIYRLRLRCDLCSTTCEPVKSKGNSKFLPLFASTLWCGVLRLSCCRARRVAAVPFPSCFRAASGSKFLTEVRTEQNYSNLSVWRLLRSENQGLRVRNFESVRRASVRRAIVRRSSQVFQHSSGAEASGIRMAILGGTPWTKIRAFSFEVASPILHQSSLYYRQRIIPFRRNFSVSAFSVPEKKAEGAVRVRFAPSPTGNLHVGGARTALFNYLFARSKGGKFILRIEDTDLERSTRESEEAMLRDLSWLGLDWDEGPGVGGDYGPYRQSERNSLYKQYADKLLQSGHVYRCFCSNEELEKMKEIAKLQKLPPVYTGKWASATDEEVQEELAKGTPYTYRFRVPKGSLKINDLIRGEVSWNLDTLGDFVIMRSNGQPVYNFCVTVDDATMAISHVIRAEEHLPNTLRQALIYQALGFYMPYFAHVSLILAPDRSKLSKRHGATSVGQFREMGYLPQAMVNYLALLGWGDGTEDEFFTLKQLVEKFTIERVNKSGAIFDSTKLRWMNGQHLRALPSEELTNLIGERWKVSGILTISKGPFVDKAVHLLKDGIDLITDADKVLNNLLSYPLQSTLLSDEAQPVLEDNLSEFSASLLAAYDNYDLLAALEEGHSGWTKWVKGFGKSLKRKGKSLFMPLRLLLTGKLHGPDMGASIVLLYKAGITGIVAPNYGFLTLEERFKVIRQMKWETYSKNQPEKENATSVSS